MLLVKAFVLALQCNRSNKSRHHRDGHHARRLRSRGAGHWLEGIDPCEVIAAKRRGGDVCVCSSAALLGKKVLHLDARSYYGDLWSGLNMEEFLTHIAPPDDVTDANADASEPHLHRFCGSPCVYEHVEVPQRKAEELGDAKDYIIELSPKVRSHALFK